MTSLSLQRLAWLLITDSGENGNDGYTVDFNDDDNFHGGNAVDLHNDDNFIDDG